MNSALKVCSESIVTGTYLLKGTLILNALGSNKHPAVSKGQLLHCRAPKLLKQSAGLVVQSVTGSEDKVAG